MVLRLHVLGPAFGLASVDAECLATITYLAYAVPHSEYELVATSSSGVPTREYYVDRHAGPPYAPLGYHGRYAARRCSPNPAQPKPNTTTPPPCQA